MDISAWDVYWIMRLDGIKAGLENLVPLGIILFLFSGIALTGLFVNYEKEFPVKKAMRIYIPTVILWIFLCFSNIFIPTTREAATIFVLPKIANSELVSEEIPKEAREIYGLAKEWFKKAVKEKEK